MSNPKVVLHVMLTGPNTDDYRYGTNGEIRKDLEAKVGGPINFVSFCGSYLDGAERDRFLQECADAQVVIVDAWNHPHDKNYQSAPWQRAYSSMEEIAFRVKRTNPRAKIFAQLMEGTQRVDVHSVAQAFKEFTDPAIVQAIVQSRRKEGRPDVLVFDDDPKHQAAAYEQLVDYNLVVAKTYDEAQMLIGKVGFDVVLLDVLVPASSQSIGDKGRDLIGTQMPLGPTLAWLALFRGAKKIGVLTDMNHHCHPASAALDVLAGTVWEVGDVKVLFANYGYIKPDGTKNWKSLMDKLCRL